MPLEMKENNTYKPKVIIGGYYKHFKGEYVVVLALATHSETNESLVIYKHIGQDNIWARPLNMFMETVEKDGKQIPRFEYMNYSRTSMSGTCTGCDLLENEE